ncbi:probable tyrosine--trna ligase precursor, mitochondrial [Fusarium mangiferae]|uniref:Tyrosine--tRNA ligase n=1 Tax=Fusarium mangiferae TaxID=192010 RepID=A0A1L7SQA6_FUSMA|nr:putative tyrosine--trna ligase precursor, mitochondrial [Fusarium mangiferae]CVK84627.1 probable tyrosine--trna ligase precursor, mitochondrial [Fusarium mangiferae]
MATHAIISKLTPPRTTIYSRCLNAQRSLQVRNVATTYLNKVAEGEKRWKERAERIQNGEIPHTMDVLQERGYIKDIAGSPEKIKEIMRVRRIGSYVGIDPTADSMHVGHLLPLMPMFWMWFHGYPAVTLIGGSTARIGDPTDRLESRTILSNSDISKNITKIHVQLTKLWKNVHLLKQKYGYEEDWAATHRLLNNNMWLGNLTLYDFAKRIARHTRIGPMLARDTVKRKMTEGDGMSLGEFMYPLLQGWDFWHMYNKLGIQMQIGGSDQYGNITAGIDALKTIRETEEAPHLKKPSTWDHEPFGFTVPLLTDSAGNKFGKSAGNAIWLDEFKTSAFDLYGYFVRRSDEEVENLLKMFTFIPLEQISKLMEEHRAAPQERKAQHTLAFEVLSLIHGAQRAVQEAKQHEFRFGTKLPKGIVSEPTPDTGIVTVNNAPRSDIQLPRSIMKSSPAKILHAVGLASSSSEGQRLLSAQGAYIAAQPGQKRGLVPGNLSWTPMKAWFPEETSKFLIDDRMLIMRKGKHNVRIVELISDEEWKKSGQIYPGQPGTGLLRRMKDELKKEVEAKGSSLSDRELTQIASRKKNQLSVANNSNIELPNKHDVRERRAQLTWDRRGK